MSLVSTLSFLAYGVNLKSALANALVHLIGTDSLIALISTPGYAGVGKSRLSNEKQDTRGTVWNASRRPCGQAVAEIRINGLISLLLTYKACQLRNLQ